VGNKDVISKKLLKRIVQDIAKYLLHRDLSTLEILDTEFQRIEDRRADLLVKAKQSEHEFLLHIEVQNNNDPQMLLRMLRYYTDIALKWPNYDIEQYLIYIGKKPVSMVNVIQQPSIQYRYNLINMHEIDCHIFLEQDNPDALILAILCDFKGRKERDVIHYIIGRLKALTKENQKEFREYISMLEILSTNRELSVSIKEEEQMMSTLTWKDLPSYEVGYEAGVEDGVKDGIEKIARQMLSSNMDDKSVAKYTGLPLDVIKRLKEK